MCIQESTTSDASQTNALRANLVLRSHYLKPEAVFDNLFWTTLWLVDALTDITPAVLQIFYVFEQRLSVSSNSLLNKHRKIWRSTKYCALNCHICRQNNTVNDSLCCVRASTPLRHQICLEQMFNICKSVGKDARHSVLTQELMIWTPNWPVERGEIAAQAEKFCFSSSCSMKFSLVVPFNHFTVLRKKALYRNSKYKLPY